MRSLIALGWLGVVVACCASLLYARGKVETSPLALLQSDSMTHGAVNEMQELLRGQAREILVRVSSPSVADSSRALERFSDEARSRGVISGTGDMALDPAAAANELRALRVELLAPAQRDMLRGPEPVRALEAGILGKLGSPLGSFYRKWLEVDPLLLLPEALLKERPAFGGVERFARLALRGDPLSPPEQAEMVGALEETAAATRALHPEAEIEWIGYVRFAHDSYLRLSSEIQWTSLVSTVGIVLSILLTFRSGSPIVFSLLSSAVGVAVATVASWIVYPSLHLFTLSIGAALSGATVDYALHFFSHLYAEGGTGREAMRAVRSSLVVGFATSVLAFAALGLSGLRGLEQIAIFSSLSLSASFLTVYLLFPFCYRAPVRAEHTWGMRVAEQLQSAMRGIFRRPAPAMIFGVILAVLTSGIWRLRVDNDIRAFQPRNEELSRIEARAGKSIARSFAGTLLAVKQADGATYDLLVDACAALVEQGIATSLPVWAVLPSREARAESRALYSSFLETHREELRAMLEATGMREAPIRTALEMPDGTFDFGALVRKFGGGGDGDALYLPLPAIKDLAAARKILDGVPGVRVFNYANEISRVLQEQMERSISITAGAYLVIGVLFLLGYGALRGGVLALQPILTTGATLGALGLLGMPIDFFSVLALVIVLGLCVDYGVFFLEDEGSFRAAATSIVLSSVTTIAGFGVLAVSSSRVLQSFGLVTGLGVFFSMLVAPMAAVLDRRARPVSSEDRQL